MRQPHAHRGEPRAGRLQDVNNPLVARWIAGPGRLTTCPIFACQASLSSPFLRVHAMLAPHPCATATCPRHCPTLRPDHPHPGPKVKVRSMFYQVAGGSGPSVQRRTLRPCKGGPLAKEVGHRDVAPKRAQRRSKGGGRTVSMAAAPPMGTPRPLTPRAPLAMAATRGCGSLLEERAGGPVWADRPRRVARWWQACRTARGTPKRVLGGEGRAWPPPFEGGR